MTELIPYIFSYSKNWSSFNLSNDVLKYDCVKQSSLEFFDLLKQLDQISFGEQGMGMERWTFYDCGAMPGAIYGYSLKRSQLSKQLIKETGFETSQHEFIPISLFIAIPTVEPGKWFAHNLSSIGRRAGLNRIGLKTKADALLALNIKECYGATQWGSPAIHIHSQLADMKLISSYTPVHSYPNTLTYFSEYSERAIAEALLEKRRESPQQSEWLACSDDKRQRALQHELEHGLDISINGRAKLENGQCFYPLQIK